jgi:putative transport protein
MELTISWDLRVQRGDILTLAGSQKHIEDAVRAVGVPDRPEESTDMVFVSAGIVIGALIGIPALAFGKLELGLSLSVGVLLGGLLWGWFHSMRPMIGRIPTPTLWIFESVGLTGFVAVVGLAAGPDFVKGLQTSGVSLIIAGIVTVIREVVLRLIRRTLLLKMGSRCTRGFCLAYVLAPGPQHRRLPPSRKPPRAPSQRLATAWPTLSGTSCWRCGELS